MIPVYKPFIPESSVKYARDAVESTWISSNGKYIDLTTKKLAEIGGYKYVFLTNNGTSATHLVARSLKRFNPEVKRVLVPSACYVAAYNSLIYDDNGWDIHCTDLDPETWNMKIEGIRLGDAVYAVHNLGNIINVPELKRTYNCPIIEDNCEGFFGTYEEKSSGTKSLCSSLSFFGNKNITSGEGGAFVTNNKKVYDFALKLHGQGQTKQRYIHDELGYNYRMTNIQAAILLGQLENIEHIYNNKARVFETYRKLLQWQPVDGIELQKNEAYTSHSMWMFGVKFKTLKSYEPARKYFSDLGIDTRPMFYSYKKHNHLNFSGEDKIATLLNSQVVVFPSYPELTNFEIEYICDKIKQFAVEVTNKK